MSEEGASTEEREGQESGVADEREGQESGVADEREGQESGVADEREDQESGVADEREGQESGVADEREGQESGVADEREDQESGVADEREGQESGVADERKGQESGVADEQEVERAFLDPNSCPDEVLSLLSSGMLTGLDNEVLRAVLAAKQGEPSKFLSLWEDDEEGVENLSLEEIQSDPHKKILWAAENNMLDTVTEMLDGRADLIESRDSDLYTALHRASYNGHVDMVRLLILRGADIEAETSDGWRPLHSACRWSNAEVASLLLQSGALVNAQTRGGQTALHLAAANQDSRETLQVLLLNDNIEPNIKNSVGETAKDICLRTSELYKLFEMTEDCLNKLH